MWICILLLLHITCNTANIEHLEQTWSKWMFTVGIPCSIHSIVASIHVKSFRFSLHRREITCYVRIFVSFVKMNYLDICQRWDDLNVIGDHFWSFLIRSCSNMAYLYFFIFDDHDVNFPITYNMHNDNILSWSEKIADHDHDCGSRNMWPTRQ